MTRNPAPVTPPVVCTIAGSDSGGGAGIQADLKTIEACGAFGTSVLTAVTAQNTTGVQGSHVLPTAEVTAQADAVFDDFDIAAVKTGMLATADIVDRVTDRVAETDAPAVIDPVMVAASGDRLLEPDAEDAYEGLVAESTLVTPNADEAEVLTDVPVADPDSAEAAATDLVAMGADAALVKGGHVGGDANTSDEIVDVLATAETVERLTHPRIETDATHGSGCALSAAIATHLASGDDISQAVQRGIDLLSRAVRYNVDVGSGPGSVHHMVATRDRAARQPVAEAVASVVSAFEDEDVSAVVPEVGMNVAGATPYAEIPDECAAVEGRITRTVDGVRANRGVRFGASGHVARFLLAMREFDADLQFAANCRFDDGVEAALATLEGPVVELDRAAQPDDVAQADGSTMAWAARRSVEAADGTPVAVFDRGAVGKEPMVRVLARDAPALQRRVLALRDERAD